jgi:glutamate N-acetyltransferase / amino-acid N-acetyltransferase
MEQKVTGGVTAPLGFTAAGVHCGIKKTKRDLALIFSEHPAIAAGVFTTSRAPAAPVCIDKQQLRSSSAIRAIIVNSGNANACTGERGNSDGWEMVHLTAAALGIPSSEVLISSTGVIGQYLPIEEIRRGIPETAAMLDRGGHSAAAEAIMTTDKFLKETETTVAIDGVDVTIGGMAKGSGMIAPNMATMLAFITTDAKISIPALTKAIQTASDRSFNRISVDGDTSTNDMAVVLANGCAGNIEIDSTESEAYGIFYRALEGLLVRLSRMIVTDGEGATKIVEIRVTSAATEEAAVQAAKAVANSNLVKTAIHGEDANWGRIIAAIGYSGVDFDPAEVEIAFDDVPILRRGYVINFSEAEAKVVLQRKELTITVDLNRGNASASFLTCDLSKEYVAINANYRT